MTSMFYWDVTQRLCRSGACEYPAAYEIVTTYFLSERTEPPTLRHLTVIQHLAILLRLRMISSEEGRWTVWQPSGVLLSRKDMCSPSRPLDQISIYGDESSDSGVATCRLAEAILRQLDMKTDISWKLAKFVATKPAGCSDDVSLSWFLNSYSPRWQEALPYSAASLEFAEILRRCPE